MNLKIIILMLLIVLFTIFVVQNTEPVSMKVFFWQLNDLPKIVLLTVTLAFGIVLGVLISTFINRRKKEDGIEENTIEQHME